MGRPLPAWEVFAVDDAGARQPANETGLFYARPWSPDRFEYHGAADQTAECYLAPDTFTIGDIGRVDANGFVYLAGRRSHTIISGGVNIYWRGHSRKIG